MRTSSFGLDDPDNPHRLYIPMEDVRTTLA